MTRYAARIDANQDEIMDALQALGVWCWDIHWVGRGVPDLLCSYQGLTFLCEVKTPKAKMTLAEVRFAREFPGDLYVVRTVGDVVELVNKRRQR
jgi:hypothetical protein